MDEDDVDQSAGIAGNGDTVFGEADPETAELLQRIAIASTEHSVDDVEEGEPEGLTRETIESLLESDHLVPALLTTAARLERELGFVAREEMDLSEHAFMEDWTETGLPKFVQLNEHLEWIEDSEPIVSLSGFRTDIMHNWGEMFRVMAHPEMRSIIREIIEDVLDLTDELEANRRAD